ncbi:hypothetical protein B4Y20_17075, partial [Listeria monocytogenes]|nr:hypothetical protein [Listeria monocytogenes]
SGKPTINVTTGSLDDDSSSDGNQIVNHLLPFSLSILKQDTQSKQTIAGVTFSLSEKGTNKEVSTLATDANGMGQFFDSNNNPLKLVTGKTYVIKETKGQDGYVLDNRTIEVTVNANGAITVTR